MKKVKQIFAIITIILLLSLYIITFICAITDNTGTMQIFFTSVVATILIPVLIWAYTFIYRLIKGNKNNDEKKDEKKEES